MKEGIISKLLVTVLGGVLTWATIEIIKPNFSNEPPELKQRFEPKNQPTFSPPSNKATKSADNSPKVSSLPKQRETFSEQAKTKEENYSSYINPQSRVQVSVVVLDAAGKISNPISSSIAEIYRKTGKTASTGLIRSSFVEKPEFIELCEGNAGIIKKLNLHEYADYLAVGRTQFTNQAGKLVDETIICTASMSIDIISTDSKSLKKSYTISNASGNGVTESQAKEQALQKLLDRYFNNFSSL